MPKSVSIEESTPDQRREFVRDFLNLDVPGDASDDDVMSLIERAQPGTTMIFVNDALTPAEQAVPMAEAALSPEEQAKVAALKLRPEEVGRPTAGSLGQGDPRAKILIPVTDTDDETGRLDVLVGVNGRAWQLRRGEELNVPWRVVEALRLAKADIVTHKQDGTDPLNVITDVRSAPRFAVQLLEGPTEEQIADWHKETDAQFCA
jgi:hypothetical protein